MHTVRDKPPAARAKDAGVTPGALLLREELRGGAMRTLDTLALGDRSIELCAGHDAIWVIVRRPGKGGIAMRAAFVPVGYADVRTVRARAGEAARIEVRSTMGVHRIAICLRDEAIPVLGVAISLEPAIPLLTSFVPRDLYPLDAHDDPLGAQGTVEAAQRGLNSGSIYFRLTEPGFGSVLYFQDLTRLNPYFRATQTKPDGAVGGIWPEIGYLLPTPPQRGTQPEQPLRAGEEVLLSDALIAFHDEYEGDERDMARRYLALLGAVLPHLVLPDTDYRDWVTRAERSLRDLSGSRKATIHHYGHRYIHPYTDAEYPDSMVQLSVLASLRDFEMWGGAKATIGADLAAGPGKFYDPKLQTLRRYLPNVGKDKDRNAVDSWYLYHPLSQLGRLAIDGDKQAIGYSRSRSAMASRQRGISSINGRSSTMCATSPCSRKRVTIGALARPMSAASMPMSCSRRSN